MSRLNRTLLGVACAAIAGAFCARTAGAQDSLSRFPHDKHATLFPLCATCHAGVTQPGEAMWPEPARCESCHDGVVQRRVTWAPRAGPRAGNRRFTHDAHDRAVTARTPADSSDIATCASCHTDAGVARMVVRNAVIGRCLECHALTAPHVDVPSDACAMCHVRLADAPSFTRDEIARFPKPASHDAPDFARGAHGKAATVTRGAALTVAASCATCHARNICVSCHVNAPESPVIRSLAVDARAPAYDGKWFAPANHVAHGFLRAHGADARNQAATCATCHTRDSCTSCHVGAQPRAVTQLAAAGPGRAPGVGLARTPPSTHTREFRDGHGPEAGARPAACESCHVRSTCLSCHQPDGARQVRYHPSGFVTRHPAAAYSRASSCADCHNTAQFCQSCHERSGLVASARIGNRGYHDAFRGFSLGHGQAARQSLESCASCHAERDCTACHSAVGGGFRFNPHGPGFNAARMRARNPSVCVACHGRVIPDGR